MNVETLLIEWLFREYAFQVFTSGYTLICSDPNKLVLKTPKYRKIDSSTILLINFCLKQLSEDIKTTYPEIKEYFDITFKEQTTTEDNSELTFNLKPEYKHQREEIAGYLRIQGIL